MDLTLAVLAYYRKRAQNPKMYGDVGRGASAHCVAASHLFDVRYTKDDVKI